MDEVREMRKAKAQTGNGKAEESKQSQRHEKRSQKRHELAPREKGQDEGRHNFYNEVVGITFIMKW